MKTIIETIDSALRVRLESTSPAENERTIVQWCGEVTCITTLIDNCDVSSRPALLVNSMRAFVSQSLITDNRRSYIGSVSLAFDTLLVGACIDRIIKRRMGILPYYKPTNQRDPLSTSI